MFNDYPYTNFNEINLDWIMSEDKKQNDELTSLDTRVTALESGGVSSAEEIYYCDYGTTTNAEIETALGNDKIPVCIYNNRLFILSSKVGTTYHVFFNGDNVQTRRLIVSSNIWSNDTTDLAPENSPGLTGTPTAPTPNGGDSTTKIATTQFVDYLRCGVADNFYAQVDYLTGDYVFYQGTLYKFKVDHPAGAWIGTDVDTAVICNDLSSLYWCVTPEMFGAVGDGVTDDSNAVSTAITFCKNHNKILCGKTGSIYGITYTIDFSNLDVSFNRARIKALSSIQWLIKVNHTDYSAHIVQNLVVDCNNGAGGIRYELAAHDTLNNVSIVNCNQTALRVESGGGLLAHDCYIYGTTASTSQGISISTSDCNFEQIIIKDCHTGIRCAGTNKFTCVHAWMSHNCDDTVCFYHTSGNTTLVECTLDTYRTAIHRNTDAVLEVIGCTYYINSILWDSTQTPRVVAFESSALPYSANIHFIGCSFDPLNTAAVICADNYTRMSFFNCFFKDGITGVVNNVGITLSSKFSASSAFTYVRFYQDNDKYAVLDALIEPTAEFTNGYITLGTIPSIYLYPADDNGTGFNARGHALLYLDNLTATETMTVGIVVNPNNGIISINTPGTLTASRVKLVEVHMMYKVKKSLDYYRG